MPITTGSNTDIAGQFFDATGSKIGSEFKANTFTPTFQALPAVATNGDNYCITWSSLGQDSDGYGIFAQLIDNDGTKIGSEFQVNTTEAGNQGHPAVTSDGTDYFIVWDDSANIFGQLYTSNGTKTGSEIQITPTDSNSDGTAAIISSGSHYLVVWSGSTSYPSLEIFGQLLTLNGIKLGTKFQITSPTGSYNQKPERYFYRFKLSFRMGRLGKH